MKNDATFFHNKKLLLNIERLFYNNKKINNRGSVKINHTYTQTSRRLSLKKAEQERKRAVPLQSLTKNKIAGTK